MDNLKEQMQELITSIRQAAEMMQGCTNHSAYAEINTKQILSIIEQAGYYPIQADSEGLVDICNVLCGGQCADNIELKLCAKFSTKQLEDINNLLKAQKALDDNRAKKEKRELVNILKDLVYSDDCVLDHHGYCRSHGWLNNSECPHARAKKTLEELK